MPNVVLEREVKSQSDSILDLTHRIQAEYAEMPGLSATMPQAQRLLNIDRQTCALVFKSLINKGFLRRTEEGRYIRS